MNPAELHTASGHSNSLDDKAERLRRRRERDRDRRAVENDEQRGELLRRRRQQDRVQCTALCSIERDTALQHKRVLRQEKLANETAVQKQARLQQISDCQQERLALHFADCTLALRLAPMMIIICLVFVQMAPICLSSLGSQSPQYACVCAFHSSKELLTAKSHRSCSHLIHLQPYLCSKT